MSARDWSRLRYISTDPERFKQSCGPVPFTAEELTRLAREWRDWMQRGLQSTIRSMLHAQGLLPNVNVKLRGEVLALVAQQPWFEHLDGLSLDDQLVSVEDLERLATWEVSWSGALSLWNNRLTPKKLEALAKVCWLSGLWGLDLSRNSIRDDGLELLLCSPHLSHLKLLTLTKNKITDKGLRLLMSAKVDQLSWLQIGANQLKLEALGDDLRLPETLKRLALGGNEIGAAGAAAFAKVPGVERLKDLDLGFNPLGDEGVEALAAADFSALNRLIMPKVGVGDRGASALAAQETFHALDDVLLSKNQISDDGARALARASWLSQTRTLDLSANPIGDEGVEAFSAREDLGRLERLSLSESKLSKEGKRIYQALQRRLAEQAGARRSAEAQQGQ